MTDMINATTITFSGYGKSFQEKIVQALIVDHRWASQVADVMRVEYFEYKYLQFLAQRILGYHNKYKCFPSFENLIALTRDDLKSESDEALRTQLYDFMKRVRANPDVNDLPYVKDKSLDFCRKQEIKETLERIVDKVESADYDEIVDDLNRAVNKGSCESIGHDFSTDREARFVEQERHPVATGIDVIDSPRILRGGLGRGELGVVVAPTGVGKCTLEDTRVDIMYHTIIVDGVEYKPWDKFNTRRGTIFAKDLREDDVLLS